MIQRVLANLILNARDACPPGGCAIIRTERLQGSDHVCLVVSDDGCGMTEELAARVFEPFITTKPAGKGVGLGLAVVDAIVQRMGGSIRVLSRPGAGSEFRIALRDALTVYLRNLPKCAADALDHSDVTECPLECVPGDTRPTCTSCARIVDRVGPVSCLSDLTEAHDGRIRPVFE